jgi:hypothetical protein
MISNSCNAEERTFTPMLTNKKDAARRKLLSTLPRRTLETLSRHERPWTLRLPQLRTACVGQWDEAAVRHAVERLFARAAAEQPAPQKRGRKKADLKGVELPAGH